ncbi:MAG: hypothetical protein HC806_05675, partial [Anaerolineae bacterium]|nr:hypothetical protein [Anaerolineae bacterium]
MGQTEWEEINFQDAFSTGGENWGWRCYEGLHDYNTSGCGAMNTYDSPIAEYQHLGSNCSVTGGYVYRGSQYPVFQGHYIFADYCTGQTWTAINNGGWSVTYQGDLGGLFTTFGEDVNGEIYLASTNGTIYRVTETTTFQTHTPTASPVTPTSTATPTQTPTPTPTQPIHLQMFASGFTEPVDVENAGDARLFVAEREGVVYEVSAKGSVEIPALLDIQSRVGTDYFEQGFLSMVFHQDFSNT